ncbi:MAG TPA: M3 family metallopeptidase [Terriglobales bacterium]|nr:M3 family metallopeptidase [Terriglobales bacterium]
MRNTLWAIFLLLSAAGGLGRQAGVMSAKSVEARLDGKEQELEQLYATYWQIQYQLEQGDTSVSDKDVNRKIRDVLNDPEFLQALKNAHLDDPILQRRRQVFLEVATDSQISTDADLVTRVESIRKDGSTIRYKIGAKLLDRPELDNVLGQETNRDLRRQAWFAQADLTKLTGDRIREVMKLRNQLGLHYANENFSDFMLRRRATNRQDLLRWFEQIRTSTEPEYHALLSRMQRDLGIERPEPWDLEYYFSTLSPGLESKFGLEGGWQRTTEVAGLMGFDFSRLPVEVKITDITFGGYTMPIWYGKEIKMLVSRHTGVRFADTMLHESGHALHFTFVQEPTFILRDNYPPPMDEGLGQTMSLMMFRPEISTTIYGLSREDAVSLAERRRLESNYSLRALMVQSEFELEAYDNPAQDLTTLYDRVCSKYFDVDCHQSNTWGYDPFFAAIPIYEQNYVLAEMFAYQVHHTLDQKFGRNWGREGGSYLHDKFLTRGGSLTLDQIMLQGTGEGLSTRYLTAALQGQPAPATRP